MGIDDPLTAYQFDSAVTAFGVAIENALQEQIKVGSDQHTRYVAKYKLEQLLADDFRFDNGTQPLPVGDGAGYDEVS